MFCYKIHRSGNVILIAACDKEILGKTFCDGSLQLEVKESFYGLGVAEMDKLSYLLSAASMANLAGNRVVDYAASHGLVDEKNILMVCGIKHAQFVLM